jgi:hypothetical protein
MDFFLFLLCNAALFLRPGEVVAAWESLPIYQVLVISCAAVALPRLLAQLSPRRLLGDPVTLCVLAFWATGVVATQCTLSSAEAAAFATSFGKVVLYYLLLIAIVDTPQRLHQLLTWLVVLIFLLSVLTLLQFFGYVQPLQVRETSTVSAQSGAGKFRGNTAQMNMPELAFKVPEIAGTPEGQAGTERRGPASILQYVRDPETGETVVTARLIATGIFADPNDLCLILTLGTLICLYHLRQRGASGMLWLVPLGLFLYTLRLTQSRGGLLALMAGLMVLVRCRLGWPRTIALGLALLPALVVLGARQTNFNLGDREDTAQARIHLWAEGMELFRQSPVWGIGAYTYADEVGQVAHNSFVHAFVETGIAGGTFFAGAVFFALWPLERLFGRRATLVHPVLYQLLPFLMAAVGAYALGMLSLSRNYVVPTYLVVGLAAAFLHMVVTNPPAADVKLTRAFFGRLAAVGMVTLFCIYLAVRLLTRYGPA